jgi:hypothetical protein
VRCRGCAALCALVIVSVTALSGCANTLQDQTVAAPTLEQLVMINEYPVYWVGATFEKQAVTNVVHDPSGAISIQYGNCVEGGQSNCLTPLVVVTSPDNSFHPVDFVAHRTVSIRGVKAALAQGGQTIGIATAAVVVDIYARSAALARAAAQTMVAINQSGLPGAPLPIASGSTGVSSRPLSGQLPRAVPPNFP